MGKACRWVLTILALLAAVALFAGLLVASLASALLNALIGLLLDHRLLVNTLYVSRVGQVRPTARCGGSGD